MKKIRFVLLGLVLAVAGTTSAYAHDSVGFSLNFGAPAYYAGPPVYYSPPPVVYYRPAPVYYGGYYDGYYGPSASFRYYEPHRFWRDRDDGFRHGWRRHGWHDRD